MPRAWQITNDLPVVHILATAAQRRGWTLTQWAEAAGLDRDTIGKLLRRPDGTRTHYVTVEALAAALGLELVLRTREEEEEGV